MRVGAMPAEDPNGYGGTVLFRPGWHVVSLRSRSVGGAIKTRMIGLPGIRHIKERKYRHVYSWLNGLPPIKPHQELI